MKLSALRAKDVGHLHGGPVHSPFLLSESWALRRGLKWEELRWGYSRPAGDVGKVEIDGRRFQIDVTEQNLDRLQIGPTFQQVRRPAVTQQMRRHLFLDTCTPGRFADGIPHGFRTDRLFCADCGNGWETDTSWVFSISSRHAKLPAVLETTSHRDPCCLCLDERESPCAGYRCRSASIGTVPLGAIPFRTTSSESRDGRRCWPTRSAAPLPPRSKSPAIARAVSDRPDRSRR